MTADASSHDLGAALLQVQENGTCRPVTYAPRSLTETEQHCAQIKEEALASPWACEKFAKYLIGLGHFATETDHKPLVPLLGGSKALSDLLLRIQRFRMRLMKYHYAITHVPGKQLETANALSRATCSSPQAPDQNLQEESNIYLNHVVSQMPTSPDKLEQITVHQQEDEVCTYPVLPDTVACKTWATRALKALLAVPGQSHCGLRATAIRQLNLHPLVAAPGDALAAARW